MTDTISPTVEMAVSDEDIRRRYYETSGFSKWVVAMQLNPLQLVVADDNDNRYYRVPISLDGNEFTFGDAVEVAIEYVDKATQRGSKAAASALVWASREQSVPPTVDGDTGGPPGMPVENPRPDRGEGGQEMPNPQPTPPAPPDPPNPPPGESGGRSVSAAEGIRRVAAATKTPVAAPASGSSNNGKESRVTTPFDGLKMREALGLAADAPDDEVTKALVALAAPPKPPATDSGPAPEDALPPKVNAPPSGDNEAILVDPYQLQQLRAAAMKGQEAYDRMRRNERDALLDKAVKAGKFPPARLEHYQRLWEADPEGTREVIDRLSPNLIPVLASGFPGGEESATESDLAYKKLYGE